MEGAVKRTEEEHAKLAAAVKASVYPVDHTIVITQDP
jgi:hypothetical protein